MFNDAARKQIVKYDVEKEYCLIHDAIIHKVVCMFGKMILDQDSHMYYRQHSNNEIGMTSEKSKELREELLKKGSELYEKGKVANEELKHNIEAKMKENITVVYETKDVTKDDILAKVKDMSDEDKKELLNIVANYRNDKKLKKQLLNYDGFKTNSINDLFFKVLVYLGYI